MRMPRAPGARRRFLVVWIGGAVYAALITVAALGPGRPAQERPARHEFDVVASNYRFRPTRLAVGQGDIVKIRFRAENIAHSFAIDDYRIAKRAEVGQTVVFEFRATRPGRFTFYCNLALDERCSEMHGEFVVDAR